LSKWDPIPSFAQKTLRLRRAKGNKKYQKVAIEGPRSFAASLRHADSDLFIIYVTIAALKGPVDTLLEAYKDYTDVFNEKEAGLLPDHGLHELAIELMKGKQPPFGPLYNLLKAELKVLREYLDKNLQRGWIRKLRSPASTPILFVKKKDGGLRLYMDYRGLNAITEKNQYPLPLIQESLDQLCRASRYTKLDLRDTYHRIRIKEGDEWKIAFRTRYGLFEYTIVPFGLSNAPGTFQGYINSALSDLLDVTCIIYLDNIMIFSERVEDHKAHVKEVLERLRAHKLYAKLFKCDFHKDSVNFLGFVVTQNGVIMEPERVQTIKEWPVPKSIREVRIFIGFANYYRRFIKGFSHIAAPLNKVTERGRGAAKGGWR